MKNRDLIKRLLWFDWDADVVTSSSEDIVVGYLEDGQTIFIDPSDTCATCISYDDCLNKDIVRGCEEYAEK